MSQVKNRIARLPVAAVVLMLGGLSLGACASDEADQNWDVNNHINAVDMKATDAQQRAQAAQTAAQAAQATAQQNSQRVDQLSARVDSLDQRIAAKKPRN